VFFFFFFQQSFFFFYYNDDDDDFLFFNPNILIPSFYCNFFIHKYAKPS